MLPPTFLQIVDRLILVIVELLHRFAIFKFFQFELGPQILQLVGKVFLLHNEEVLHLLYL